MLDRKWPARDPLGYGYGDHRCIAEALAKAELTTVFGKQFYLPLILNGHGNNNIFHW